MSRQDWRTPWWLFKFLNEKFGCFMLDAAASAENSTCNLFHDKEFDGLVQNWMDPTFCNPPFKRFGRWMEKAWLEWSERKVRSVLIGPVGCSQKWFHDFRTRGLILVPDKRISFLLPDGTPTKGANRDTMIYLFGYGAPPHDCGFKIHPLNVR